MDRNSRDSTEAIQTKDFPVLNKEKGTGCQASGSSSCFSFGIGGFRVCSNQNSGYKDPLSLHEQQSLVIISSYCAHPNFQLRSFGEKNQYLRKQSHCQTLHSNCWLLLPTPVERKQSSCSKSRAFHTWFTHQGVKLDTHFSIIFTTMKRSETSLHQAFNGSDHL